MKPIEKTLLKTENDLGKFLRRLKGGDNDLPVGEPKRYPVIAVPHVEHRFDGMGYPLGGRAFVTYVYLNDFKA